MMPLLVDLAIILRTFDMTFTARVVYVCNYLGEYRKPYYSLYYKDEAGKIRNKRMSAKKHTMDDVHNFMVSVGYPSYVKRGAIDATG